MTSSIVAAVLSLAILGTVAGAAWFLRRHRAVADCWDPLELFPFEVESHPTETAIEPKNQKGPE